MQVLVSLCWTWNKKIIIHSGVWRMTGGPSQPAERCCSLLVRQQILLYCLSGGPRIEQPANVVDFLDSIHINILVESTTDFREKCLPRDFVIGQRLKSKKHECLPPAKCVSFSKIISKLWGNYIILLTKTICNSHMSNFAATELFWVVLWPWGSKRLTWPDNKAALSHYFSFITDSTLWSHENTY